MGVSVHLIGCAVAVQRDAHLIVSLVLAGQSNPSSQWNLDRSQLGSSLQAFKEPNEHVGRSPELPRCRCLRRNGARTCASTHLCLWPRPLYDLRRRGAVKVLPGETAPPPGLGFPAVSPVSSARISLMGTPRVKVYP